MGIWNSGREQKKLISKIKLDLFCFFLRQHNQFNFAFENQSPDWLSWVWSSSLGRKESQVICRQFCDRKSPGHSTAVLTVNSTFQQRSPKATVYDQKTSENDLLWSSAAERCRQRGISRVAAGGWTAIRHTITKNGNQWDYPTALWRDTQADNKGTW